MVPLPRNPLPTHILRGRASMVPLPRSPLPTFLLRGRASPACELLLQAPGCGSQPALAALRRSGPGPRADRRRRIGSASTLRCRRRADRRAGLLLQAELGLLGAVRSRRLAGACGAPGAAAA